MRAGTGNQVQQELARNRIQHIRSRPHHPQTLGKIETLLEDDLGRVHQPGALRDLRGGAGAPPLVGAVLQSPAAAPGLGWLMPGGPGFTGSRRRCGTRSKRDRGEREGTGRARQAAADLFMMGRMGDQSVDDQNGRGASKTGGGKAEDIGDEHNEHRQDCLRLCPRAHHSPCFPFLLDWCSLCSSPMSSAFSTTSFTCPLPF